ncbi:tRNA U34 5-methylaminomethyl-2-thiouridine-forming methyltransferase MnmC [Mangrovibacterium marinum]|uniref:tRNA U34 5-methylaminomethyl-2-thiouridine-forming methyltransferase MnmC n=2 Tax=Mangrovibacterium marinum TaxID=1639118 RepID=A0A2T5BZ43_9BACT|nr:tRNA U34 5-methylaminomethyl-2-thiouridine-forming methyltransferase MnmC [Mangrovibacterium marinum]
MDRELILTADGSHTLYVPALNEHFHSVHGAIQESMHVFIKNGLQRSTKQELCIFEVGFGTGLNALLTLANKGERNIRYFSIEKYPLTEAEFSQLNFSRQFPDELSAPFEQMHQCPWNKAQQIAPGFELTKLDADLTIFNFNILPQFDLIYFDAFAPNKQADMWSEALFATIAAQTRAGGLFVTYCAQGEVRRKLTRSGFDMQRIPGPPGKKEMLFGQKPA